MLILDLHNDQQLTDGNKDKAKKDAEEFKKMQDAAKEAAKGEDDDEEGKTPAADDLGIKKTDADAGGGCFACCGPRKDDESDSDEAKKSEEEEDNEIPEPVGPQKKSLRPFKIGEADSKEILELKEKLRKEHGGGDVEGEAGEEEKNCNIF